MANMTVSRLGLVNATGTSYDALFLKVFSGEVLSAFRKATVFENLHTVRTISSGRATSTMEFFSFTAAPRNIAESVIADATGSVSQE